jgi:hypothetical protein
MKHAFSSTSMSSDTACAKNGHETIADLGVLLTSGPTSVALALDTNSLKNPSNSVPSM